MVRMFNAGADCDGGKGWRSEATMSWFRVLSAGARASHPRSESGTILSLELHI